MPKFIFFQLLLCLSLYGISQEPSIDSTQTPKIRRNAITYNPLGLYISETKVGYERFIGDRIGVKISGIINSPFTNYTINDTTKYPRSVTYGTELSLRYYFLTFEEMNDLGVNYYVSVIGKTQLWEYTYYAEGWFPSFEDNIIKYHYLTDQLVTTKISRKSLGLSIGMHAFGNPKYGLYLDANIGLLYFQEEIDIAYDELNRPLRQWKSLGPNNNFSLIGGCDVGFRF